MDDTLRVEWILTIGCDCFLYTKEIAAELEAAHGANVPFVSTVLKTVAY
jgi:hypothetical protein